MSRNISRVRTLLPAPAAVAVTILAAAIALTPQASSAAAETGTIVAVSLSFTEPVLGPLDRSGCPVAPEGFCGHGLVRPFGQAHEQVGFGACGANCDVRTVTLPQGSLVLHEVFSDPGCPGVCRPNPAEPATGNLAETVAVGTGSFSGATGTLTGSVHAAGLESQVDLRGWMVLGGAAGSE